MEEFTDREAVATFKAGNRFIQKQETGAMNARPGDSHALPEAIRQARYLLIVVSLQVRCLHDLGYPAKPASCKRLPYVNS